VSVLSSCKLHLIESFDEAQAFMDWFGNFDAEAAVGVDTETTGFKWHGSDHVRMVQVGDGIHGWAMQWDRWSGLFAAAMKLHEGPIDMMNAKFDYPFLRKGGVLLPKSQIRDVGVMAHILEPHMSRALKNQAKRHIDPQANALQWRLDEAIGAHGGWTWATVPCDFEPYWSYAALDPVLTYLLSEHHLPTVQEQAPYAYELENAFQWVALNMETLGVPVDVEYAQLHYDKFMRYCEEVEDWCKHEYGIKPGSNAAVVQVLSRAGFEFSKATASGAVSLDKEVLGGIEHPLAKAVLQRRQLQKIASTYLRFYVEHVDSDGRIHPSINTLGARTSRMSMSEPNFQNLPVRGGNPGIKVVRNCVRSREGYTLVFADFDQIEMRGLAIMSSDQGLIDAFNRPEDFFVTIARNLYGDTTLEKSDPRRQPTKNGMYAKIYGAGIQKQAVTAGVSYDVMRFINDSLNIAYPGVERFASHTLAEALSRASGDSLGYTTCPLTGRRHYAERGKEYALVNYKIQGWAAALFKQKLLEADAAGLDPYMIIPVHDEIILEVPDSDVRDVVYTLHKVMNDDKTYPVPISASVATGKRWGEKKEWEE